MQKAGNPFKVYDRFYIDPKTKQYMSESEMNKKYPSIPTRTTT